MANISDSLTVFQGTDYIAIAQSRGVTKGSDEDDPWKENEAIRLFIYLNIQVGGLLNLQNAYFSYVNVTFSPCR